MEGFNDSKNNFILERAKFADSYINRMRGFRNQLLIWGCSLNYLAGTYILKEGYTGKENLFWFVAIATLSLNFIIAEIYDNEHTNTIRILGMNGIKEYLDFKEHKEQCEIQKKRMGKTYTILFFTFCIVETFWFALIWGKIEWLINIFLSLLS